MSLSFNHVLERQRYVEYETFDHAANDASRKHDFFQPKYDGIWAAGVFVEDRLELYSRTGALKATLPAQMSFSTEPHIVLGEYMYGSQWSKRPGESGKFYVFDCLMLDGVSQLGFPYKTRYNAARVVAGYDRSRFDLVPCLRMGAFSQLYAQNLYLPAEQRLEGFILRKWDDHYTSDPLYKLKYEVEDDYVVMGLLEGEGKHAGRLGAFIVGQYNNGKLVEVMRVGGGLTDYDRAMIWADQTRFLGRVIKVTGKARFASGALRHPNFKEVHNDKLATDCILVKDEDNT